MSPKRIAYSHSRLEAFGQCPKKFHAMNISKELPYIESVSMAQGKLIHKMLEDRISLGTPIPVDYAKQLEPLAASVLRTPGKKFTEIQLALNWDRVPCGYKDWDRVAARAQLDVLVINGTKAWVGDWKTGKRSFDEAQNQFNTVMVLAHFPEVQTVGTAYIWTNQDPPAIDPRVYTRVADEAVIWADILTQVDRIQAADKANNWPPKPNKYCPWCGLNAQGKCDSASGPPAKKR